MKNLEALIRNSEQTHDKEQVARASYPFKPPFKKSTEATGYKE